jgi:large subunit ribosomal protein L13
MLVIDASGLILGRLSSIVAKRLLEGDIVSIVNAEKAVVSGSKVTTFKDYQQSRQRGIKEQGPYYPKRPDRLLKRTIRGMLPYKRQRGRDALSRLKVYVGMPKELAGEPMKELEGASMSRLSTIKYIELGELSRKLGGKF